MRSPGSAWQLSTSNIASVSRSGSRCAAARTADAPHLLMLSATPIPRTLAMSYLADLDVSVIDELPPGRRPVVTKLISTRRREEVMQRIRADVAAGRQAYWVCPLIESSEVVEVAAATETFERITRDAARPAHRIAAWATAAVNESRRHAALSSNANSTCWSPRP